MHIYPSILEKTTEDLFHSITTLLPIFDHFQIDIADGFFVGSRTVQIEDMLEYLKLNPLNADDKTFEMHLMVENYEADILKINELKDYMHVVSVLIHFQPFLRQNFSIPTTPYIIGITLNPEDDVAYNWKAIKSFDTIQLMTVRPGKQGQPFLPEVLDKITKLRELGYTGRIILDGAINSNTLPIVLSGKHLPDAVCPGSYFQGDNPRAALQVLQDTLTKAGNDVA